tara:strand:- start:717 stop:929 length:213 start_codon:yes stop_codon:yes gene_type:complete
MRKPPKKPSRIYADFICLYLSQLAFEERKAINKPSMDTPTLGANNKVSTVINDPAAHKIRYFRNFIVGFQ